MCGIAGYIGPRWLDDARIDATLESLRLRGPDARDFAHLLRGDTHVYLLHTRLAIIDLDERANQPMTRGPLTVAYNGEIYNYRELRDELERDGPGFETESDTEVLLRAYQRFGPGCVDRLEGMWAFALFDAQRSLLLLSRDRFGEKPLWLRRDAGGLYFASTPPALFALSGETPRVNHRQVCRYLVNGYKSLYKTDERFFEGIEELSAATSLAIQLDGRETRTRYWLPRAGRFNGSFEDAAAEVRTRLTQSLRLRLRADVPVAFCLSGGVDSGALASLAVKQLGVSAATFSIIDHDPRYDESDNIRRTVADLGCSNVAIEPPRVGTLDRLAGLIEQRAAPLLTLSYYVHALLSETIAQHGYRVALSGTGADELFTGYYDHFNLHLHELRGRPGHAAAVNAWHAHIAPLVRNPHLQRADLYDRDPGFREHIYLNRERFAALLKVPFNEGFFEQPYCPSLLRNRMLNELLHETVPPILHEDDANSMRVSVENRSPYLDSRLVELACALPAEYLIADGYAKRVLRAALAGVLEDAVRLDRRKVGFNVAFRSIIDSRDAAVRDRLLADGPIFELVDRAGIERLLDEDPLPNSLSKFLFYFVNARLFLDRFAGRARRVATSANVGRRSVRAAARAALRLAARGES